MINFHLLGCYNVCICCLMSWLTAWTAARLEGGRAPPARPEGIERARPRPVPACDRSARAPGRRLMHKAYTHNMCKHPRTQDKHMRAQKKHASTIVLPRAGCARFARDFGIDLSLYRRLPSSPDLRFPPHRRRRRRAGGRRPVLLPCVRACARVDGRDGKSANEKRHSSEGASCLTLLV